MRLALIGALTAALIAPAAFAGDTLDRVTSTGTLNVATNAGWPPQSFLDDSNQLVGFDIDVATEIAKRLGVTRQSVIKVWIAEKLERKAS